MKGGAGAAGLAPLLLAALLLAGCGRGEDRAGQPSAEEAEKIENIAGKLDAPDGTDVFDTSADSKVPAADAPSNASAGPANTNAPAGPAGPGNNQAAPPAEGANRMTAN